MNVLVLTGRLVRDPVIKNLEKGNVCAFSLAINRGKNKDALFVECDWWGTQMDFMSGLSKGDFVTVMGELDLRKWKDKDDNERTSLTCKVNRLTASYPRDNKNTEEAEEQKPKKARKQKQVEEPEDEDVPF